jgi:hypothetical protein
MGNGRLRWACGERWPFRSAEGGIESRQRFFVFPAVYFQQFSRLERDFLTQSGKVAKTYKHFFTALQLSVSLFPLKSDEPFRRYPIAAH